jgi:hypothetical protein
MNTDSVLEQNSAMSDFEVNAVGEDLLDVNNSLSYQGNNQILLVPSASINTWVNVGALLKRTGSSFNPLGMRGYPPYLGKNLPTLINPLTRSVPKGVQINSVDVLIGSNANLTFTTAPQFGLWVTNYIDNAAPIATPLIPLGTNGIPATYNSIWRKTNIPVAVPNFLITSGSDVVANLTAVTPGPGQLFLNGFIFHCSFNLN